MSVTNRKKMTLAAFALCVLGAATLSTRSAVAVGSGELRIRVNMVNAGVDTNAKGRAEFRDRSGEQKFKVQVQRLDAGTYDLLVGGVMRAQIVTDSKGRDEVEFKTNPEPGEDKLPLTFDPRGQLVEIKQGNTTFLSVAFPSAPPGGGGGTGTSIVIKTSLVNTGALPGAKGTAEYRSDGSRNRFKVEIEKVPFGDYGLRVDSNVVGTINVATNSGEVEFDTNVEPGHLPLTFDPRGKLVEVLQGSTVVLQIVFPN